MGGQWDSGAMPGRGETYYSPTQTPDTSSSGANLYGNEQIGKERWFDDVNPLTGNLRSNAQVRCLLLRNDTGTTVYASQCVHIELGTYRSKFDRLSDVTAEGLVGIVDEWLPSGGCVANDSCWVVIQGPTLALTSTSGGALNVINQGDCIVAITAATSGASDAGHVASGGTTSGVNIIGRAESAATTSQTNSQILLYVGPTLR